MRSTAKQNEFLQQVINHVEYFRDNNDLYSSSHNSENRTAAYQIIEDYFKLDVPLEETMDELANAFDTILDIMRSVK